IVEMENPNHPTIEKNFIDNSVCSTRTDFKSMVGFDKYPGYVELKQLQAEFTQEGFEDIYFRLNSGTSTNTTMIDGRSYINYSGYNYLGLSGNSRVIEAVYAAIKENGTSASASRLASGEKPLHRELESLIAGILNVQDALVFSSGHATNVYTITSLFGAKDLIIHDALVHNSLQQGAIYSGAMRLVFPHNDYSALEAILATYRDKYERVLIITEGVFSMDGDIPNILKLIEIKKRYFAYLMVDEAHSMGVIGDRGLGVRELFNLNSNDIDIWMGTLSKSFASCGGYIAGSKELIEYIKYRSGGFIFSAAISPSNTAAAIEAIKILLEEPWRVRKIQDNAKLFLSILKDNKVDIGLSNGSPIIPIIVNKDINALKLSKALYSKCILAMPIIYPAVEKNFARVRLFINCLHTEEQIHQSAEIIIDEYHKLFK
ncbi:MAG: aminotransferase class I/II-fold pyridoxal phosphate-dependent enzyme, partial [Burkholderiales bacterium]|nr:aminotransferase class I/II-fold pyridoxal phosphate-dependent enzyme [Burkholderiales bacterium]